MKMGFLGGSSGVENMYISRGARTTKGEAVLGSINDVADIARLEEGEFEMAAAPPWMGNVLSGVHIDHSKQENSLTVIPG